MEEKNNFINILLRIKLMKGRTPLNNILPLEKTLGNKIQHIVPRALTVIPVVARGLNFFLLLLLVSLAVGFLFSHS
jgi:hypothetical protein